MFILNLASRANKITHTVRLARFVKDRLRFLLCQKRKSPQNQQSLGFEGFLRPNGKYLEVPSYY